MKQSLVFDDGQSRKFWTISTSGPSFTVTFGRLGAAGQTQVKTFASDAACEKEASALVASKLKKGYSTGKGAGEPAVTKSKAAAPARSASKDKPASKPTKLSSSEWNALQKAIELGQAPKVKAILKPGREVNLTIRQKYGAHTTPLLMATTKDHPEIVALLLAAGADPKATDERERTALHLVRSAETARKLVEGGAPVNARERSRSTPLHHAAREADLEIMALLLEHGAEVEAKNDEGQTAYEVGPRPEVRALLSKHGAKGLAKQDGQALKPQVRKGQFDQLEVEGGAIAVSGGEVWIGSGSSIHRWDGKALTTFEFEESFSVDQIAAGPAGTTYFSTNWGLLVCRGDKRWTLFTSQDSGLHDNHLVHLAVDREGRAFMLGYGGEEEVDRPIAIFDGKTISVLTAGNGFAKGITARALAFDAKNQLVIGSGAGVVGADGKRLKGSGSEEVRVLAATGQQVWAADWNVVTCLEGGKKSKLKTPEGVNCLRPDGPRLWIGLSNGGLMRVEGKAKTVFTPENSGLSEDDVEGLALAADGTLWIAAGMEVFCCRDGVISKFDDPKKTK